MVYLHKKTIKNKNYFYLRSSKRKDKKIVIQDISYLGTKISEIAEKAKKDNLITAVLLFGSSLKKQGRDIDICLVLKNKQPNLQMSKKRLEYLRNFKDYDIQIFQQLPLYIKLRILKENLMLLCKDEKRLYQIAFETIKEIEFYKKLYNLCMEKVKNG